jgi:hypothetical protein
VSGRWQWLLIVLCWPSCAALAADALQAYYQQSRCDRYVAMQGQEHTKARQVFKTALEADKPADPELAAAWQELGFAWLSVSRPGGTWWIAKESQQECRGRGFYIFNTRKQQQTVLQVPHRFKDRYTGSIALKCAQSGAFRAIAWNTAPRRIENENGVQNADLAHRWDSYFVPFTEAFAAVLPQGRLVQLHGFAAGKRKTAEAAGADIIVSAGSHWPTSPALAVSSCLQSGFPANARLFPRDVSELGGTRNQQGRLLRGLGHNGFVHLELSDSMRDALRAEAGLSEHLCACLRGAGV